MRSTLVASRILPSHASPRTPYATEIGFLPIQSGLHFRRFVRGAQLDKGEDMEVLIKTGR